MTPSAERLLTSLPCAVFTITPELTIAAANPAAEHLTAASAQRLIDRPLTKVFSFADPELARRMAAQEGELIAHGAMIKLGETPERPFDLSLSPVLGEQGWQVLTLSEADRGGEGTADSDSAVLRAPAILSHEIKNPLAAIRGASQLLARKLGDSDKELTSLISTEVERIASLLDRMQALGTEIPEPVAPCNLHEAIRRARTVVETASNSEVELVEEFDPSLPPVLANQGALEQILINLLTNAGNASLSADEPRIAIRTRFASGMKLNLRKSGRAIELPIEVTVMDNGSGIDPEIRDHIFEPFVSTRKNGQGLGLALVRKLIRDMNGRISHERDDAKSLTLFRIHLPVAS